MTTSLKTIYEKFIQERPSLKRGLKEYEALKIWREVVSPGVERNTNPQRLKHGVLWVGVRSSTWAQELFLFKKELIGKLNEALGEEVVRDIRFRVGSPEMEEEEPPPQLEGPRKTCPQCGVFYKGRPALCPICEREYRDKRRRQILRAIKEVPWRSFEGVKEIVPDLKAQEYERARRDLKNALYDQIKLLARNPQGKDRQLQALTQEYAIFHTGLPPKEIDDRVVKEVVGEALFFTTQKQGEKWRGKRKNRGEA